MSFYTYYGKLKDELFVAVLPNGTVELEDQVHLYFQKRLITYRVQDVDVNDDGEDCFALQDGYYNFDAVTSKAYKEIKLTRTCRSGGEVATVALTRHYDQAQIANSTSRPKIWTGAIDFHDWAKNESFIVVAPQGLGNAKPILAIWQWTKDNKGTAKTLSYGVSKQTSEAETPAKFSFKQNDYYTLDCQVVAATKGLNVTVTGPTNAAKVQKELAMAPYTDGAEHRFVPPRARQEKISFECSLPNAKPSLPRINAALPFPADLVETLSYSAAYVDQAGYLAKYAVKQFEKLDRSYHLLEKKAEARATKVAKLEGDVDRLTTDNHGLKEHNKDLEAKMEKERKEATKVKADLQEQLRKALAALQASQNFTEELEKHIAKDKLEDIARERAHAEHDKKDHAALDAAHAEREKAENLARELQKELDCKDKTIVDLKRDLKSAKRQLEIAGADILRLSGDLAKEKKLKGELQAKLDDATHRLSVAEQDIAHLRTELANTQSKLSAEHEKNVALEEKLSVERKKAAELAEQKAALEADLNKVKNELQQTAENLTNAEKIVTRVKADLVNAESKYKELKEASESNEERSEEKEQSLEKDIASLKKVVKETKDRANASDKAYTDTKRQLDELREQPKNAPMQTIPVQTLKAGVVIKAAEVTSP
jgi:chromosome segregation ATPase